MTSILRLPEPVMVPTATQGPVGPAYHHKEAKANAGQKKYYRDELDNCGKS